MIENKESTSTASPRETDGDAVMSESEERTFTTAPDAASVVLGSNSHQNHPGNKALHAESAKIFLEYENADDPTKKSIVNDLANKYRFVQYTKDNNFHVCDMTKESDSKIVTQSVRKRFNNSFTFVHNSASVSYDIHFSVAGL